MEWWRGSAACRWRASNSSWGLLKIDCYDLILCSWKQSHLRCHRNTSWTLKSSSSVPQMLSGWVLVPASCSGTDPEREVDPGRAPRGVCVRLAPACRNYRQLPASWGQLWLRLLTSLCGQRTASSHLEVESDSKSDCWRKQWSFIYILAASMAAGFYHWHFLHHVGLLDKFRRVFWWSVSWGVVNIKKQP